MKLKVLLPTKILLEEEVLKIIAEGLDGSFCLLPKHIDFLSILIPNILTFQKKEGEELYLIHDEGVLIKQGPLVFIAIHYGVVEKNLGTLKTGLEKKFQGIEKEEKETKRLLSSLEADFMKRFLEIRGRIA